MPTTLFPLCGMAGEETVPISLEYQAVTTLQVVATYLIVLSFHPKSLATDTLADQTIAWSLLLAFAPVVASIFITTTSWPRLLHGAALAGLGFFIVWQIDAFGHNPCRKVEVYYDPIYIVFVAMTLGIQTARRLYVRPI